jgi:hypothetical protein
MLKAYAVTFVTTCNSIVTSVTRVWSEMKFPHIIVTNVTGCYKCYSTGLQIGQKIGINKVT